MDIVVDFLRTHLLLLFITGIFILFSKLLLLLNFTGFSLGEFVLSFFTFYNNDEIESVYIKRRASYMRWNNFINTLFYCWIFVVLFYLIVTLNTNQV